jgi:hypothetical protein
LDNRRWERRWLGRDFGDRSRGRRRLGRKFGDRRRAGRRLGRKFGDRRRGGRRLGRKFGDRRRGRRWLDREFRDRRRRGRQALPFRRLGRRCNVRNGFAYPPAVPCVVLRPAFVVGESLVCLFKHVQERGAVLGVFRPEILVTHDAVCLRDPNGRRALIQAHHGVAVE